MSNTIYVSTANELKDAMLSATGGETILLSGGDYGGLGTSAKDGFDGAYASNVTIASADPNDPAIFSGMNLTNTGNITIESVVFDYVREESDPYFIRPFQVAGSENITIKNSVFDGATKPVNDAPGAAEYGFGSGLSVRNSSDIVVEGNEFHDWIRGLIVDNVDDIAVRGNDVHDIRSDGMNFVGVTNVLIEENHIHDFEANYASNDHRDMIQFWTNGTTEPSTDIVIRNNTLDIGEGSYTQSIFMRNEAVDSQGGGQGMYYQNVLIEGNTIYNGHLHGITVGETNGLTIRENSLVAIADQDNPAQTEGPVWVPMINVKPTSDNVLIEQNAVAEINGHDNQSDWLIKNNAFIQNNDPFAPGYYGDVFVTSSQNIGPNGHHFVATPGEMLDVLNAGTQEVLELAQGDVAALFQVEEVDQNIHVFDASLTAEVLADNGIQNAQYTWHFGDGETAQGLTVEHEFTHAGTHNVSLFVTTPAGTFQADTPLAIQGGQLVSFNGAAGAFTAHGYGEENTLAGLDAVHDGAIQLGGTGSAATLSQSAIRGLRGSDTMNLDFTISGQGSGEVFRLHGSFISWIGSSGEVIVQVKNEDGTNTTVRSTGVSVTDGNAHDVSVVIEDQNLVLMVNDAVVDSTDFVGTLPNSGSWGLAFGNPWGKNNFDGEISEFNIQNGDVLAPLPDQSAVDAPTPPVVAVPPKPVPVTPAPAPEIVLPTPEVQPEAEDATPSSRNPLDSGWSMDVTQPVTLDGDFVRCGRLSDYEDSQKVGFSVDFNTDEANGPESRLIWNHLKLGLTIRDDEIMVQAATKDEGFKGFATEGLGLTKGDLHNATILLDSENDRLQVLVNDEVVLDIEDEVDFDHVGGGGHEWGWFIGTPWGRAYNGEVSNFEVSDRFEFREEDTVMSQADLDF